MIERMIGAARLDAATYEAVERDEDATVSAMIVVLLAAIAGGIGFVGEDGFGGLILGLIAALIGWVLYAVVAFFIGTRLFGTVETRSTIGEVLRTLGFAQSPGVLRIFGFIPLLGWLISLIVAIWILITTIVALRQSLDFTTGRAIGTAIVSWIAYIIPNAILLAILT